MLLKDIINKINAKIILLNEESCLNKEYKFIFASDLMSDALAMINNNFEKTIVLTGLCNPQALRTAEMLDIKNIIFVRGKIPDENTVKLAEEMKINLFSTENIMYKTCGLLYTGGLEEAS